MNNLIEIIIISIMSAFVIEKLLWFNNDIINWIRKLFLAKVYRDCPFCLIMAISIVISVVRFIINILSLKTNSSFGVRVEFSFFIIYDFIVISFFTEIFFGIINYFHMVTERRYGREKQYKMED